MKAEETVRREQETVEENEERVSAMSGIVTKKYICDCEHQNLGIGIRLAT